MKATTKGFVALTVASAIWGAMYVASDALMRSSPPLLIQELREAISAAILLVVAWRERAFNVARQDWPAMIGIGIVGFSISIGFQFFGTHDAGAALGSLVTASSPILIAILGAVVLHEHVPKLRWIAIAIATVGVVIIVGTPAGGPKAVEGVLLLLVAAVCWALYTIGSRQLLERYRTLTVVTWATVVGALVSLPFATYSTLTTAHPWPEGIAAWAEVGYISVIGMAVAFFLWIWGFRSVPASRGGVLLLFQPLVGVILGVIVLGETISIGTIVGAVAVAFGVTLAVWEPKAPAISAPLEP
ncbi:MAG: DMT family transporter [Ferrimicrobium sp.]